MDLNPTGISVILPYGSFVYHRSDEMDLCTVEYRNACCITNTFMHGTAKSVALKA